MQQRYAQQHPIISPLPTFDKLFSSGSLVFAFISNCDFLSSQRTGASVGHLRCPFPCLCPWSAVQRGPVSAWNTQVLARHSAILYVAHPRCLTRKRIGSEFASSSLRRSLALQPTSFLKSLAGEWESAALGAFSVLRASTLRVHLLHFVQRFHSYADFFLLTLWAHATHPALPSTSSRITVRTCRKCSEHHSNFLWASEFLLIMGLDNHSPVFASSFKTLCCHVINFRRPVSPDRYPQLLPLSFRMYFYLSLYSFPFHVDWAFMLLVRLNARSCFQFVCLWFHTRIRILFPVSPSCFSGGFRRSAFATSVYSRVVSPFHKLYTHAFARGAHNSGLMRGSAVWHGIYQQCENALQF